MGTYKISIFLIIFSIFSISEASAQDLSSAVNSAEIMQVDATSYITTETDNLFRYHPVMAFDGIPETAWNEGAKGSGIDEMLRIFFDDPIMIDRIEIMPGYFNKQWYGVNNRISSMLLIIDGGPGSVRKEKLVNFEDTMETKIISIVPMAVKDVILKIKSVYRGSLYDDTCISEISFFIKIKKFI